jgi:hypothetical protein
MEPKDQGNAAPAATADTDDAQATVEGRGGRSPYQFTQDDVNKVAGKRAREAAEAKERELSASLGVSVDEARDLIRKAQEREDANKDAQTRLQEREAALKTAKDEAKAHQQKADRYEQIVRASVEAQLELMPEDIRDLLSEFEVAVQFEKLSKHGDKWRGATASDDPAPPRRAPDASRRTEGASQIDEEQSFADTLRRLAFSGQ